MMVNDPKTLDGIAALAAFAPAEVDTRVGPLMDTRGHLVAAAGPLNAALVDSADTKREDALSCQLATMVFWLDLFFNCCCGSQEKGFPSHCSVCGDAALSVMGTDGFLHKLLLAYVIHPSTLLSRK
jgi:hypothetical protein